MVTVPRRVEVKETVTEEFFCFFCFFFQEESYRTAGAYQVQMRGKGILDRAADIRELMQILYLGNYRYV